MTWIKRVFTNYFYPSLSAISMLSVFHFFTLNYSFSQPSNPKTDSLFSLLKTEKEDTSKINTLNILSWELTNIGEYEQAKKYTQEALQLSKKINFKSGQAVSYNNLALIYDYQGIYDKALINYSQALKIRKEITNEFADDIGNKKRMASTYNNIGVINVNQGNYSEALKNHLHALKIREKISDKRGLSSSYGNLGEVNRLQGNLEVALKYYGQTLKLKEEIGDEWGVAASYNNIGIIYQFQHNYDEALKNYLQALKIREKISDKKGIATSYNNIGIIYDYQGNYEEALKNYFQALKIKEELNDKGALAATCINIGTVYATQKKYSESKNFLTQSLLFAKQAGYKEWIKESYSGLSQLESMQSNWKEAYQYHQLYAQIKDSIFNEESNKQITEMQTKYETEKKEQQINLLNKDKELQSAQLNRQKIVIWSAGGGLFIVLFFSYFIFKERRKSEKLLLNILPVETARELKKKGKALPKQYELVTVLFTDFIGFTKITEKMSVEELVSELDFVFRKFDEIISKYPIEKIKTIGDAYMCAGGLPVANTTNPIDVVMAALDIQQFVEDYKQECIKKGKLFFEIRIGIHSGPVVAGVVGDKKFAYDIWGDAVNIASRMESSGEAGKVNISGETYKHLVDTQNFVSLRLRCTFRGKIPVKNKGEIEMYFLEKK